MPVLCYKILS